MKEQANLARRTLSSISWNMVGSLTQIVLGFVRSVLLARLLPVEVFGVYAWAKAVLMITAVLPNFGLAEAFLHRSEETRDEEEAAANYFTLQALFTVGWAMALVLVALIFPWSEERQTALLWITITTAGSRFAATPRLILTRRVVHRRLTLAQLTIFLLSSVVALFLAWRGFTLWALLATDFVTVLVNIVIFYLWRPVWRPRLRWDKKVIRYFLKFGSRNLLSSTLLHLLDRVDDLWVGTYLDNIAMGLYSRAYTFATYPRKLVAGPVQSVSIGTYAELKEDHTRLSQAFYRTNALLVRVSFLFGGILSLVAPELIHLLLGEKWLPMLDVFRLMLIYTLFDPIKLTVANIFVAVGKPEKVALVRALQFVIMVVGLYTLGPRFGIAGVAIAVDLMLVAGIIVLFWQVRAYVDYSLRMLLQVPLVALLLGLALSYTMMEIPAMQVLNWYTGLAKGGVFIVVYVSTLLFLEFGNVRKIVAFISGTLIDRVGDEEIVDNG